MRYILIILVFLSVGAKAQMVIKAHANYRPYAQPAANLLLDDYPNAAAAYSLRKLRTAYTGNCIRIRRDSTGQAETDIGFDASGIVDTNAIKDFCRNNQCNIVTWYDQSGNGRNMTQGTALNQPVIKPANLNIVRRNNKPSIFFTIGESDRLSVSRILSNDDFSIFGVAGLNSIQTGGTILAQHAGTADLGRTVFLRTGDGSDNDNAAVFFNNGTSYSAVTTNTYTIATPPVLSLFESESDNLGTTTIKLNGSGTGTISGQTWTPLNTNTTIGALGNGSSAMNGGISEIIIYSTKQANADGIRNNINDYYNIYWNGDLTGILDTYPNSAAAYSLRNLSSTYKGPLIRVRKDTTGQPEIDVYGDYFGNLDTASLKSFLNARSGFVTTWYDQSGNARNASQATQANQPRIALNGVIDRRSGDLAIVYDGSNDYLENNTDGFAVNNVSHYAVSSRGNDADALRVIYSTGTLATINGFGFFYTIDAAPTNTKNNIIQQVRSTTTANSTGNYTNTLNVNNLIFGITTSSTDYTYYNGGDEKTTSHTRGNVTSTGRISIGARLQESVFTPGFYLNGTTTEIVFWEANQSSNRTGIQNNINSYYGIH